MPLQWTGDLRRVVDGAERDALRMEVRMNTALLLRSMLKTEGPGQEVLEAVGINLPIYERGLKSFHLQPEPLDAPQRVYERAARLSASARLESVSSLQVLIAMQEEVCMGQALLQAFQVDANSIRKLVYSHAEFDTGVMYQRSVSQSMNSVAVQRKSPIACPTTYIEPQPAVSFGSTCYSDSSDGRPSIIHKHLMTPSEITRLGRTGSQPSLPGIEPVSLTLSPDVPSEPEKRPSSELRRVQSTVMRSTSSRVSQQETTLDLAKRLKEKKSKTSEARRASREMPKARSTENSHSVETTATQASAAQAEVNIAAQEQNAASLQVDNKRSQDALKATEHKSKQPTSHAKPVERTLFDAPATSGSKVKETKSQKGEIICRKTLQSLNENGSVYARKSAAAKLPSGFNPLVLDKNKFPMLCTYGRNLLAEAAAGRIDPVLDREHEIDQLIDILNKRRCNNPILVGEAGVGKTAIIEGLALRMARSEAPRGLEHRTIIALDYGSILCGTQLRGAVQERIKAIKSEVSRAAGNIILFLDEIHSWLASGSGDPNSDAALELKMALTRGELICIGASTPQELRRAFNSDPAFERRFDFIEVKAPSPETSIRIIEQGIITQYAEHHGVTYQPESIREAVRLSERYIQERALPDKAISILDRAGSLCERSGEQTVTPEHVAHVVAQLAEVPVERLLMTEKQKLMKMEEILGKRLVGHESNIARIANVIRRNHAGFGAQRPIGSFLFLGPTGVGKTEAAKVLADYLFGSPKNIVRFDMSEFMEQHSVAKLIGAPAGYVGFDDGGLLTEALRKRPYQIVLFDEIEKAHPDVMNILLQILDEGRLTDAKGRHVDFSNTVIIMTSNLGAAEVMQAAQTSIGFAGKPLQLTPEETESIILKSATARFTPELWNRIEEKLVFHPLTLDQIERIAHLLLADSAKRLLADKRIVLSFEESTLIPYLIQNGGFEPSYGARPMRKTIQSLVESKIAEWILEHDDLPKELFVNLQNDVVHVEEIKPL